MSGFRVVDKCDKTKLMMTKDELEKAHIYFGYDGRIIQLVFTEYGDGTKRIIGVENVAERYTLCFKIGCG
ncbi:hypothetical protein LCGC14_0578360 [marine sediment metagenome]|uniref:Uncharacterized protein n=1 Tax=marine sediment metagenome TaxID=412755 RepID=A0A0F9RHA1_9ZZZZ